MERLWWWVLWCWLNTVHSQTSLRRCLNKIFWLMFDSLELDHLCFSCVGFFWDFFCCIYVHFTSVSLKNHQTDKQAVLLKCPFPGEQRNGGECVRGCFIWKLERILKVTQGCLVMFECVSSVQRQRLWHWENTLSSTSDHEANGENQHERGKLVAQVCKCLYL